MGRKERGECLMEESYKDIRRWNERHLLDMSRGMAVLTFREQFIKQLGIKTLET